MAGIFSKLFKRDDAAKTDATRIYRRLMDAARQPAFYGTGRALDNYDGRIDVLTLHLSTVLHVLGDHGEQGKRLSQAIYEVMREDFDIALREEGMSDTGVMKRIKPMIRLFYTRIKAYTDAFITEDPEAALTESFMDGLLKERDDVVDFAPKLARYTLALRADMAERPLGALALAEFEIPPTP